MLRPCQNGYPLPSCLHNGLPFTLVYKHSNGRISQYPFLIHSPSHYHTFSTSLGTRFIRKYLRSSTAVTMSRPQVVHLTREDDCLSVAGNLAVAQLGKAMAAGCLWLG